jgi:8-oxo-dGTP pyrophosphatase MutT (NUDIX family)
VTVVRRLLRRIGVGRAPRGRQVVAAVPVCARAGGDLEILLVRTSDGARWTFPKGGREHGETLPEAAAREAVEEAGAAGRVGVEPLGEYRYRDDTVAAFLLEVDDLRRPAEPWREPTWFGFDAALGRLAEGRDGGAGEDVQRVLLAARRSAGGGSDVNDARAQR